MQGTLKSHLRRKITYTRKISIDRAKLGYTLIKQSVATPSLPAMS